MKRRRLVNNSRRFLFSQIPYPEPPSSKSRVRKAGEAISEAAASDDDIALVEQWRAAHGYVINTFQIWLKRHINRKRVQIDFAQRLKRMKTVSPLTAQPKTKIYGLEYLRLISTIDVP